MAGLARRRAGGGKEPIVDSRKERIAVNYGLAALVYGIAGALIARLLRR